MSDPDEVFAIGARGRRNTPRIRLWATPVVVLAAILFQVYVPLYLPLLHHLEVPLLLTIYFALSCRRPLVGALLGAAIGLVQDALSYQPIGVLGMVKTVVGYLAASVGVRLDTRHPAVRLGLCTFFFLCHQLLYWLVRRMLLGAPSGLDVPQALLAALANGGLGVLVFLLLDKLRDTRD